MSYCQINVLSCCKKEIPSSYYYSNVHKLKHYVILTFTNDNNIPQRLLQVFHLFCQYKGKSNQMWASMSFLYSHSMTDETGTKTIIKYMKAKDFGFPQHQSQVALT